MKKLSVIFLLALIAIGGILVIPDIVAGRPSDTIGVKSAEPITVKGCCQSDAEKEKKY